MSIPQKFSLPLYDLHWTAPHRTAPVFFASSIGNTATPAPVSTKERNSREDERNTRRRKPIGSWSCGIRRASHLFILRCNLPWQVIQKLGLYMAQSHTRTAIFSWLALIRVRSRQQILWNSILLHIGSYQQYAPGLLPTYQYLLGSKTCCWPVTSHIKALFTDLDALRRERKGKMEPRLV